MKGKLIVLPLIIASVGLFCWLNARNPDYIHKTTTNVELPAASKYYDYVSEIPLPAGYTRLPSAPGTFATFLRELPIKKGANKVYLYNGQEKHNQNAHWAVIDIDTGDKDLQQCADVTMRLWGEYLYKQKRYNEIKFNFLSDGKPRYFKDYAKGDLSYPNFRKYMDWVFTYANTASLYHELKTVELTDLQIGDLFIFKGVPVGHAEIVVDMAIKPESGEKMFLLVQGWMPAQDMHILKNPNDSNLSPWYSTKFNNTLVTPEFTFSENNDYKIKRYGAK